MTTQTNNNEPPADEQVEVLRILLRKVIEKMTPNMNERQLRGMLVALCGEERLSHMLLDIYALVALPPGQKPWEKYSAAELALDPELGPTELAHAVEAFFQRLSTKPDNPLTPRD